MNKQALRTMTRSLYDLQKLRIQTGNRIAINFRAKLGQNAGEPLEDENSKKIIKEIEREYKRLTDGIVKLDKRTIREAVKRSGVITEEVEFRLVQSYLEVLSHEEKGFASLKSILESFPIYTEFLEGVKGCGPAMSAVIVSEMDPHKARHVSGFWKYSGLDVAQDGRGRSRQKDHLVKVEYQDREGEMKERDSITFNPFLKTKLTGVLGSSFLKSKSPYADIYYDYKNRLVSRPDCAELKPAQIHARAIRYSVKIFLRDLWVKWRTLEGLPVTEPYAEAKLGMKAHAA